MLNLNGDTLKIIDKIYRDGYSAGIDRAVAQFSVAVNKGLIGFYPDSGVTGVIDALELVNNKYFDDVLAFEAEMHDIAAKKGRR